MLAVNVKALFSFLCGAAVTALLFVLSQSGSDKIHVPVVPKADHGANPQITFDPVSDRSGAKIRPVPDSNPDRQTIDLLTKLAVLNPDLVGRLNLYLFDYELKPLVENCTPLGMNENDAGQLAEKLKAIYGEIKKQELKNYRVLDQNENSVRIALPPLPEDIALRYRQDIQSSFSETFDPALGEIFAKRFIETNSMTSAGLTGQNRIVIVNKTSEAIFKQTGRQFTLEVRTLHSGTTIDDAAKNLDNYTAVNSGEIFLPAIPEGWEHLFKTVN